MLHAYAIAQPTKRLSFKVLKGKNESSNWTYGPKPNATLVDAALKVAGPEIISLCTSKVWPSEEQEEDEEVQTSSVDDKKKGYKLVALLPKTNAGNDYGCSIMHWDLSDDEQIFQKSATLDSFCLLTGGRCQPREGPSMKSPNYLNHIFGLLRKAMEALRLFQIHSSVCIFNARKGAMMPISNP